MANLLKFTCFIIATIIVAPAMGKSLSNPDNVQVLIGSTSTKEFYTFDTDVAKDDFARSLQHTCGNIFQMQPAAVETEEEFELLNKWFIANFDNSTTSEVFWTSGMKFGRSAPTWASTGESFHLPNSVFSGPWHVGCACADAPMYSWNKCVGIAKVCNRVRGYDGCAPIRTEFFLEDCRQSRRVICQKLL